MIKTFLIRYYIDIIFILLIPLISLSGFLFKPGYYFYADQGWPLSNYLYANGILSPDSLSGFSFSRLIIDWPYYILTLLTNNVEITERIFIYYTFVLYTLFAYIFASMITSKFLKKTNKYQTKLVKFIIILFIFSNFTALNLNADGGSYSDGLNIIFIAIILLAFISWKNMRLAFVVSTILLTISILVEPDYTTFYLISILVGSVIAGLLNKDFIYRFKYALLTIISAAVPVSFILLGLILTSSTTSGISAVGALRVYNYGTISFFSGNIKPLYPLILVGHLWSTIVYAPPNILLYGNKISYVKALMYPSQLLLPGGYITDLWLFTVIMIPILALSSIIFKRTRRIAFPVYILFIIFYAMSLVYYIKPLFYVELWFSKLPLIGGSIGTTLSLPGHIINVIASMYYILFSITIINIFNTNLKVEKDKIHNTLTIYISSFKDDIKNKKISLKNNKFKVFITVFIVCIVLFSGWQAFDGSFYPARAPDNAYGNNVANIGGFTPLNLNQSVIYTYNYISSQKSAFNIIWIGGPSYSNRVYESPHPTVTIPGVNYMVKNNLTTDFYYNLLDSNVKYIVISNQDIQQNIINNFETSFSEFGFSNFTNAQLFMDNVPNLIKIYSKNQVDMFYVSNSSNIYKSDILINSNVSNQYIAVLPDLFHTLGYNAVITDYVNYGIPLSINSNNNKNVLYSPTAISKFSSTGYNKIISLNSTKNVSGTGHNYGTGIQDNYTLTLRNNNPVSYNYSDGILTLYQNKTPSNGITVSYNGSFDGGAGGISDNNEYINLTVSFYAKSASNITNFITFMGEPKIDTSTDNVYTSINYNVSDNYKKYTFSYLFPPTEKYIDYRIYDNNNGTFAIKNLTTELKMYNITENSSLPFGNYITLNNTVIKGNNDTAVILLKNSTLNKFTWITFNYSKGLDIINNSEIAALFVLNNNLNNSKASYIESMCPSAREYKLDYNGTDYTSIPGIYGNSIFIVNGHVNLHNVKIITIGKLKMDIFYISIILYLIILTYFMLDIYRKIIKSN